MADTTVTKKEKILVIEGDATFGGNIVSALQTEGYEATLVSNGTEGLKAIFDTLPHLIILDIILPGVDGYEVLERKFAEKLLTKIPVFLMSTQGVPINMRRLQQGSVTEFIVTFHADPTEIVQKVNRHFGHETSAASAPLPAAASNKKKIVWVEDDKLIGTILAKKLISSGFDLFHAKTGEEAIEALSQAIPDAIVSDLILPGMSGFDVLKHIHDDQRLNQVPIMVLSNLSKPSDIERAKMLGAKKFMVKAASSLDQIAAEVQALVNSK